MERITVHVCQYPDRTNLSMRYRDPDNGRLALLLKVEESNDPSCPASGTRVAFLVLVKKGGVRDTVALYGVPTAESREVDLPFWGKTTVTSEPCKFHAHAWEQGSGGVTVILKQHEEKP